MEQNEIFMQAESLYKKVDTFIISCVGEDGYPLVKAVVPGIYRDSIKEIYFCTNTSSKFANALLKDEKATVYFYSRKLFWKGCMLKGKMEIVDDLNLKEKYWQNKFKKAYKEESFTDPDFCLLKFTAINGRYYSFFKPKDFII